MISKTIAITLALSSTVFAAPTLKPRQDCHEAYSSCVAAGTPEVACSCTLAACVGEDNERERDFCATATANLSKPTSTAVIVSKPTTSSIPGGCNPAHPGSCPSSYFSTSTHVSAPVATSIPGGCNPAHPGSCPSSYFSTSTLGSYPVATSIPGGCNPAHPGSCPTPSSSAKPVTSSIPGGCNPAHPGSCPSSYFVTLVSTPVATSIPGGCNPAHPGSCPTPSSAAKPVTSSIPGGCNPAHPGSCPSSYFSTSTLGSYPVATSIPGGCNPAHPGSCPTSSSVVKAVASSIPGGCNPAHPGSCPTPSAAKPVTSSIPGGCNPAHPGSCPTPSAAKPVTSSIPGGCNPAHPGSCPTPSAAKPYAAAVTSVAAPGSNPVKVAGETWSIVDLIRYCADDNSGCDYNFDLKANGKTQHCTIIRMPGSKAATESWSNEPCTTGSKFTVSWGYVASPAPAFAVMTVVEGKEVAWFGVSNVNGQKATANNPFGSGEFGNLGPEQVYTY